MNRRRLKRIRTISLSWAFRCRQRRRCIALIITQMTFGIVYVVEDRNRMRDDYPKTGGRMAHVGR